MYTSHKGRARKLLELIFFLASIFKSFAPWSIPKVNIPIDEIRFWRNSDEKKEKMTQKRVKKWEKLRLLRVVNEEVIVFNEKYL